MDKKPNKVLKITKIVFSSIFYLIILILLIFSIATLSRKSDADIPNLFGFGFLAVDERADSMVGDNKDSFNPGDLVFVRVLSEKEQDDLVFEALKEGAVIVSFYDRNIDAINTHRVVDNGVTATGREYIVTQGDNEDEPDPIRLEKRDIIGIYMGKAKGMGKPIAFVQTQMGFALVVILPMLILLAWQGYQLIRNLFLAKEEQLKEQREQDLEKIRQELLEEMKNKKEE